MFAPFVSSVIGRAGGDTVPTPVWNPSDKAAGLTLSNSNMTVTGTNGIVRSITSHSSGIFYFEVKVTTVGNGNRSIGICQASTSLTPVFLGDTADAWNFASGGSVANNGANKGGTPGIYGLNDVIGVKLDLSALTLRFYKNGSAVGSLYTVASGGTWFAAAGFDNATTNSSLTINSPIANLPVGASGWG